MARTAKNKLKNNVRIWLPKYVRFQFLSKHCQWWSECKLSGRLMHSSCGRAKANDCSPTVRKRDGRTVSWLEVDDRCRLRDDMSATRFSWSERHRGAVPWTARYKQWPVSVTLLQLCQGAYVFVSLCKSFSLSFSKITKKTISITFTGKAGCLD